MKFWKKQSGQSLVEILLAIGVMAILLPALLVGVVASRQGKPQQQQRFQALTLLKEANEAVRSVREKDWNTFANDGTFYPSIDTTNNSWKLNPGSESISGFTRQIVISGVYRATSSGAIVQSAASGYLDPSTKKVVTTVSWQLPYSSNVSSTMYLTRQTNLSNSQTTVADFNSGTNTTTSVVATTGSTIPNDGQVQLGAGGGGGDWCAPSSTPTTFDLQKNGVANAVWAIEGEVYTGQGNNASGVAFQRIGLTTNQDPPIASNNGWLNSGSPTKTNGIYADTNYAYITTDTSHSQVIILNMNQFTDPPTNSNFKQVGTIDLGTGSIKGVSIFVANNYAYVTGSGGKLWIYALSADRTTATLQNTGGLALDGVGQKVLVAGSYAYIATNSTATEMDIVNIQTPSNPTIVGRLALGTGQSGVDVYVNTSSTSPTRAYIVTSTSAGKSDFYVVNIQTPTLPTISGMGSYDTLSTYGLTPTGITQVTGNRIIVVGTGTTAGSLGQKNYVVFKLNNDAPSYCAGLSYPSGVFGVASVLQSNSYAYSYIITGDQNAELKIILGGAGNQYSSSGYFESAPFYNSSTNLSSFNRFTATVSQPSQTTLKLQVSVAKAVNGSCNGFSYTYLGPGSGNPVDPNTYTTTYYTPGSNPTQVTGQIPIYTSGAYANPGQCFRYKVWFTSTDINSTPELYDMTINYSP